MKINVDSQKQIRKRINSSKPHPINKFENINHNISNLSNNNNIKNIEINENTKNYKPKIKYFDNTFLIPEQVMKTLLISMNKNTHLSLNSLNLVNFIYQSYNKGINIVKSPKNIRNKSENIENCVNQRKFITNFNPNFSMYSKIIGERNKNNIYENIKFNHNEELININDNDSFNNKDNCSNLILPNNSFFKKNVSMKNIDSNYNRIINKNKKKLKTKYKIINNKDYKNIFKRSNSCKNQFDDKKLNESKMIRYKLLKNKYDSSNNYLNFALLPIKNIISNFKKIEKMPPLINNKNIRTSSVRKNINNKEKDNPLFIKMFTEKYEKEKENFNNILFDECIELRKKKFKLESFIKRFTNKHFVEKLYKAKEYSLKKCWNQ